MKPYLQFIHANRRFLGFGVALTFFSSIGQTFFIAMFGDELRAEFDLTDGGFGRLYMLATLASGLTLMRVGRLIDCVDLRAWTAVIAAALAAAALFLAHATTVVLLGLALFSLRLCGQGLMGHTAMTSMARYYDRNRGIALSIAGAGFALGFAVFEELALRLRDVPWRQAWTYVAAGYAVVVVPFVVWLLRGQAERHRLHLARLEAAEGAPATEHGSRRQWTRKEVVRDARFWLALPAAVAAPFLMTGFIFHGIRLVEGKGWSLEWYSQCFVAFGVSTWVSSLVFGVLIDRVGARRLLPLFLIPLGVGLAVLATVRSPVGTLLYLSMAGISAGATVITGALWAELYGVAHLGAIRALSSACMVFSTALSPWLMGELLDARVSMEAIAWMALGYVILSSVLAGFVVRDRTENA